MNNEQKNKTNLMTLVVKKSIIKNTFVKDNQVFFLGMDIIDQFQNNRRDLRNALKK